MKRQPGGWPAPRTGSIRAACGLLCLLLLLARGPAVSAGEPTIAGLNPRGLQIGGTTTLTVDGSDLDATPRLLFSFPAQQTLQPKSTDRKAVFEVALGKEVPAGFHHLRVVSEHGVSLPVLIGVDPLPQLPFAAKVDQLPVALHGSVTGSAILETRFAGKAGQKVLVEAEAQRLGGRLRPVVHLYNARRLQLAWSWPMPRLAGDARLEATLPDDGECLVTVHDTEYASGGGPLRLKIGDWSYSDHVFPPVISRGEAPKLELVGSTTASVAAPSKAGLGVHLLPWPEAGTWSGLRPSIRISPYPEIVAAGAGPGQELPSAPVGVSGRLTTRYGEDRYRLAVTANTRLRFEVHAERFGSSLDAALVVRSDKGDVLARAEDSPGTTDPLLEYTVPANVSAVVVGVYDAQGRAGPRSFYRLAIEPVVRSSGTFQLLTPIQRVNLAQGGRAVLPIWVERGGYEGPVQLSADGLPAGIQMEGHQIPEGADGALVLLTRGEEAGTAVITQWSGKGADERAVQVKGHPLERLQPWLAREIAVAPTTRKAADFDIAWNNLPDEAALIPGAKLNLPVTVTRTPGDAPVRLTVLTSQNPPLNNNQPDPNRTLRTEKPIDLAANAAAGEVTLVVPAQVSGAIYDVTVQADLLAADKKTVLATAFAPPRRLNVQRPIVVALKGMSRFEVPLNPKADTTVKVQGTLERKAPLGDVTLNVTGLPAGVRAAPVTVKAGAAEFAIDVVFPANYPAGEVGGVKLIASAVSDPKQPNVRVSSRELLLTFGLK